MNDWTPDDHDDDEDEDDLPMLDDALTIERDRFSPVAADALEPSIGRDPSLDKARSAAGAFTVRRALARG
jgi:hypothetical protein